MSQDRLIGGLEITRLAGARELDTGLMITLRSIAAQLLPSLSQMLSLEKRNAQRHPEKYKCVEWVKPTAGV